VSNVLRAVPSTAKQAAATASGRDALVAEYLPLARALATRYRRTSEPIEDLTQVAYVGLVLAAGRYDAKRGTSLLVDKGASIRPAMAQLSDQERTVVAMRFLEDLTQSEIARRIGVSQMQVSRVLRRAVDHLHRATQPAA
jgi:DNA-directed RNA polymerase specialized sigma subunit